MWQIQNARIYEYEHETRHEFGRGTEDNVVGSRWTHFNPYDHHQYLQSIK